METNAVQEASIVRLAFNALHGMQSALLSIEKISGIFCSLSADRTCCKISGLWDCVSSTSSLGNILKSIMSTGSLVFVLQKFVEHFSVPNSNALSSESEVSKENPPYSLVNQSFAVAVAKVLKGYVSALDTLFASVGFRRGSITMPVEAVPSTDVTLLDVFLHTRELSDRITCLGNICDLHEVSCCLSLSSSEDVNSQLFNEFHKFYKGGDLLSYLYRQLQVSDPGHHGLLKFLFLHSCEPYCRLLRSWIFEAEVADPFEDFFIQDSCQSANKDDCEAENPMKFSFSKIRETVHIPCFLRDSLLPIVRTGQQLQMLQQFLVHRSESHLSSSTYKEFFFKWNQYDGENLFNEYQLSFKRKDIEIMTAARKKLYAELHEKANALWENLRLTKQQVGFTNTSLSGNDLWCFTPKVLPSERFCRSMNLIPNTKDISDMSDWSERSCWSDSDDQTDTETSTSGPSTSSTCGKNVFDALTFVNKKSTDYADNEPTRSKNTSERDCENSSARNFRASLFDQFGSECSALRRTNVTFDKSQLNDESKFLGLSTSSVSDSDVTLFELQNKVTDYPGLLLSRNPMLNGLTHQNVDGAKDLHTHSNKRLLPFMDFSTVKDPHASFRERISQSFINDVKLAPSLSDAATTCKICSDEKKCMTRDTETYLLSDSIFSPKERKIQDSTTCIGGSSWETLLCLSTKNQIANESNYMWNLSDMFDFPLDIVIKKCILQEILLQYNYVSRLCIRFLEEEFELSTHFLALRRYYFMEAADWADHFVTSLWQHKWHNSDLQQAVSVVQRLLTQSVQRSSCENDPKKDRLFIYTRTDVEPHLSSPIGATSYNFIGLGYRVNWPINIVVTESALKIYANIFRFLVKVKLSAFLLADVWKSLKHLTRLIVPSNNLSGQGLSNFNMLMKTRHQLDHFLATLQQYLQSQLSQVSWCNFIDTLQKKVNDVMDLKTVHLAYLTDSQSKCFLSDSMLPVANILEDIFHVIVALQQFASSKMQEISLDNNLNATLSKLNMSQLHVLRQKFETSMKGMYQLYIMSHKHADSALSRFWECLNGNEYYSVLLDRTDWC